MRRRTPPPTNAGLALAGTLTVHAVAMGFLFGSAGVHRTLPPTYTVRLVAAPAPDQETRPRRRSRCRASGPPPAMIR